MRFFRRFSLIFLFLLLALFFELQLKSSAQSMSRATSVKPDNIFVADDPVSYKGPVISDMGRYGSLFANPALFSEIQSVHYGKQGAYENCIVGNWLFYCNAGDEGHLYAIRLDGTGKHLISSELSVSDLNAFFCIRNGRVYFMSPADATLDKMYKLCSINLSGNDRQILLQDRVQDVAFFDKDVLFTIHGQNGLTLGKVNYDGSNRAILVSGDACQSWRFDRTLLYSTDSALMRVDMDSRKPSTLALGSYMDVHVQGSYALYIDKTNTMRVWDAVVKREYRIAEKTADIIIPSGSTDSCFYRTIEGDLYCLNMNTRKTKKLASHIPNMAINRVEGNKIWFTADTVPVSEIRRIGMDGKPTVLVSGLRGNLTSGVLSGNNLYYTVDQQVGRNHLLRLDVVTGKIGYLATTHFDSVVQAVDGGWVYVAWTGAGQLAKVRDNPQEKPKTEQPNPDVYLIDKCIIGDTHWATDGWIYYVADDYTKPISVFRVSKDGRALQRLLVGTESVLDIRNLVNGNAGTWFTVMEGIHQYLYRVDPSGDKAELFTPEEILSSVADDRLIVYDLKQGRFCLDVQTGIVKMLENSSRPLEGILYEGLLYSSGEALTACSMDTGATIVLAAGAVTDFLLDTSANRIIYLQGNALFSVGLDGSETKKLAVTDNTELMGISNGQIVYRTITQKAERYYVTMMDGSNFHEGLE